ncbi:MAG: HEPN domain-containing protein [Desulfurococcaceae archaeon]|jgi:HEPN domain-containing protein|nr:HEPN domain-containing protein [Desulfurococcaceae archaeon]
MNNIAMAKAYIKQAFERLKHAKEALNGGNYPYVVRQSQEAVELLLKAALRIVGVEPPKWHDVGPVLKREADRFPQWFRDHIPKIARISRKLRREREPSMYGDEESGIPPDELYDEEDSKESLNWATEVYQLVLKLFKELTNQEIE